MPVSPDLAERTLRFAIRASKLGATLRAPFALQSILRQFVDAGTAVGSNYRAAGRARSYREFTARMGVVAEEADESEYWLDVLGGALDLSSTDAEKLLAEARELRGIFIRAHTTAEQRLRDLERQKNHRPRARLPSGTE